MALYDEAQDIRRAVIDRMVEVPHGEGAGVWFRYLGTRAQHEGNDAGTLRRASDGYVGGADFGMAGLRAGLSVAYVQSQLGSTSRASSADAKSTYLTGYVGGSWNGLTLRGGVSYAWHTLDTDRTVAFGSFSNTLTADEKARTVQGFVEAGYAFKLDRFTIEPFANGGYQRTTINATTETGGPAGLTLGRGKIDSPFGSVGLRSRASFGGVVHLDTSLAQRFERGRIGVRDATFASGGRFTVLGQQAPDTVTEFGGGVWIDIGSGSVGASYTGRRGDD